MTLHKTPPENRIRPAGKTRLILQFHFQIKVVTTMALMLTPACFDVKKKCGRGASLKPFTRRSSAGFGVQSWRNNRKTHWRNQICKAEEPP
jgi:hypothetical protein